MKKIPPVFLMFSTLLFWGTNMAFAQNQRQTQVDSLQKVLRTTKEDTNKVNTLIQIAYVIHDFNLDTSIVIGRQALQLAERIKWKTGIGRTYNCLGIFYYFKGDYVLSINNYLKAISIYDEIEKSDLTVVGEKSRILILKSHSLVNIGIVYDSQSEYPKVIDYYFKALKIVNDVGDSSALTYTLWMFGKTYYNQYDYAKALDYYFKALKIVEKMNKKNDVAGYLNDIGTIYFDQGDYLKALDYYSSALKAIEEVERSDQGLGVSLNHAGILGGLGNVYEKQGNYSKALDNYLKQLKMNEKLDVKTAIAGNLASIANFYSRQANYSKALEYDFRALEMEKESKDKKRIAEKLENIGSTYIKQNKLKEADKFFHDALKLGTDIKALDVIKDTNEKLSELYRRKGDWKKAFEYREQYFLARDSISNEANGKKQASMEMNYEFEKKEVSNKEEQEKKDVVAKAEIKRQTLIKNTTLGGVGIAGIFSLLLMRAVNRRRKTTFDKQVSEVEMKALRSQMNPHFIFNSLNSIDDYIQKNDIENSSMYLNKFSRLTRTILESSRMEEVPLKDDLETLDLYIQLENLRMKNKIRYTIHVAPELDTEQTLIPPMLLQPFVENAFKHAFSGIENPEMDIDIALKDGMVICTLKDNGIGREKSQVITVEEKTKHESLGLKVTQERLDIINRLKNSNAYIAFEDLKDGNLHAAGTKVQLAVPVSYMF